MVSKLRRLIADHADLRNNELPPNYLFCTTDNQDSDDLSQLIVMLAGPHGTPYSAGLWRLQLRIPDDYPASPPKAAFRTRIWHPNVEQSTGAVCVDTLKRDWESKLTLRDILVTISCLLIHPNPDSALNAMAGSLLQDDYNEFARQARLMTSLHAPIPFAMKAAVLQAKQRGEDPEMAARIEKDPEFREWRQVTKEKASLVMKKRFLPSSQTNADENMDDVEDDYKENDESLSPELGAALPTTHTTTRRRGLAKRPLSVLPITQFLDTDSVMLDSTSDDEGMPDDGMTASERNIAANTDSSSSSSPSSQNSSIFSNHTSRQQTSFSSQSFPNLHNNSIDSTSNSLAIYEDNVELDSLQALLNSHNSNNSRRPTYGKENIAGSFSSLPKELSISSLSSTVTSPYSTPTGVFMKPTSGSSSSSSISLSSSTAATKPLSPTKVTKPAYNSNNSGSTRKGMSSKGKPRLGLRRL